ncbi:MAG: telomere resolvase [Iphinoe sp. HA4291-MV1]|jgi:integrase|nr:telomere resolvase [Iphinoe sp. HA4291-MV1]
MTTPYNKFVEKNIRTAWVKTWTVEFLKGLENQATKPEIERYCQTKLQEFSDICKIKAEERAKEDRNHVNEHSWKQSSTSYMSGIRKAIIAWSQNKTLDDSINYLQETKDGVVVQHLALLYMKYTYTHNQPNTEAKQAKKDEQRRNLESINCVDEYQTKIDELLTSTDHRELVAGLIAATGRRPSEIYRTAEFKQVGQFEVMFSGQLKTRGEEREPYPTYTLVESAKVIDSLARLRRMPEIKAIKKLTLAEIDSGKNNKMNAAIKQHFTPLINPPHGEAELSAKNLRASYAAIAIYLFCPHAMSTNLFIKERLGHTSDATATAYEDYQVTDHQEKPLTRGAWVQRIGEEMNKPMEAQIVNMQMRATAATRAVIDDQEFLPFGDRVSRLEELVRLAKIGKQFEEGKLVKEVVTVVEKPVEKIVEVPVTTTETTTKQTEVQTSAKTKQPKKDPSEMTNEELFGSHAPNTGEEKIRRAVQAIKVYNERQASFKDMWAINSSVLKELTNCRTAVVEKYLKSPEGLHQVINYNLEKQLGYQHNRGRGKASDFIKFG